MKQILEYLETLDFSAIEAQIYLTLLQEGPLSVAEVAKRTHINRTAAYPYLSSLMEKGIIAQTMQGTKKQFVATEPERIKDLIEKKAEKIEEIKKQFPDIVNLLHLTTAKPKEAEGVKVRYYKGPNGIKDIYEEALQSTELRTYFNSEMIMRALPKNEYLFAKAIERNKQIKVYEILEYTPLSKNLKDEFIEKINISERDRYFAKFFPKGVKLSAADILIYHGKVATINVGDTNNISGVVMQNTDYYNNSKELFDLIWRMLPEAEITE